MGGGNGQKAKMAREKNMEKMKAAGKGSQLDSNKKAMTIQVLSNGSFNRHTVQGVYADIHLHYIRGEMQGACRSQASKIRFLYLFPSS
ncbi:unnamed protein product [Camellia sinensis]